MACSSDFAVVSAATEVYYAVRGEWPSSQDDLLKEGIIRTASSRFTIGADGVILPAAFSGCTESTHGVASTTTAATITAAPRPAVDCIADKTAIEVALSAYTSKGQPSPATEAALVAAGYLVAESSAYDIGAGGAIVATTGGPCT